MHLKRCQMDSLHQYDVKAGYLETGINMSATQAYEFMTGDTEYHYEKLARALGL